MGVFLWGLWSGGILHSLLYFSYDMEPVQWVVYLCWNRTAICGRVELSFLVIRALHWAFYGLHFQEAVSSEGMR